MKELSLEEIKEIEISLLRSFVKICDKQNYSYSLAGGSLLGAVRHGGFIPWDDDIDILMPREDYERFIDYCNEHKTNFDLISCRTNDRYERTFSVISDRRTIVQNPFGNRGGYEKGIVVDIFPVDGAGNTVCEAKKLFSKTKFKRELLIAAAWKRFSRSRTRSIIYEPIRFIFYLLSRLVRPNELARELDEFYKRRRLEDCEYATSFSGSYREKEVFTDLCKMKFEGEVYSCLVKYDEYLRTLYGDYMKLPTKDKQVSHHDYKAYWRA